MSSFRNRVQLVGNLGADPEVITFDNGKMKANFKMATNETYSVNDEVKTDTQWHNIVVWGKQAEITQKYLKKGSEVAIEGKLSYRSYEDKEGQKKFITEILLSNYIIFPNQSKSE